MRCQPVTYSDSAMRPNVPTPRRRASYERALGMINFEQISRTEADELIELYTATAEAHYADNNPGRASSLYNSLISIFKEKRFSHPATPELEKRAQELYNESIQSKLMGISRGGNSWLDPDKLPDAGEMPPMGEDATRMDLGSGPKSIEGGTHIIEGGTEEFQVAMNNDKPTSLMRSGGGALRSITEYLRAASIPGMGNSGNLETTGPINNSGSLIPGDETLKHADGTAAIIPTPDGVDLSGEDEQHVSGATQTVPGTRYFARGVSENGGLENVTTTANEEICG